MKNYFATLCRDISCLYKTIGWKKKHCLYKTPLKILGWIMVCRDVGMEVEKRSMVLFMKNAHCVFVL
jgi:hypothetical protein